jgi:hypothetical protein
VQVTGYLRGRWGWGVVVGVGVGVVVVGATSNCLVFTLMSSSPSPGPLARGLVVVCLSKHLCRAVSKEVGVLVWEGGRVVEGEVVQSRGAGGSAGMHGWPCASHTWYGR